MAVVGLMLTGCSDAKKASKRNFAQAIDRYLEKHPLCVSAPTGTVEPAGTPADRPAYPAYVAKPLSPAGTQLFDLRAKPFEALVKAGLLASRDGSIGVRDMWDRNPKPVAVKEYDLTEAGRKALDKGDGNPFGERFCYGIAEVAQVTQYTEPSAAFGMTVSEVSYDYRVKDRASWSRDPIVVEAFPVLKTTSADILHARAAVVLMNDGWVDSRDAKR